MVWWRKLIMVVVLGGVVIGGVALFLPAFLSPRGLHWPTGLTLSGSTLFVIGLGLRLWYFQRRNRQIREEAERQAVADLLAARRRAALQQDMERARTKVKA